MKKSYLLFLILLLPVYCHAQFIGLGGQYSQKSDGQFAANLSFPYFHQKNNLKMFISGGVDYTTYGGTKLSGLNVQPIKAATFFGEDVYNKNKCTFLLGVDAGYLFNFKSGHKNGIILTPNLYFDYKFFFIKAGYDFDVLNGVNQYFVRTGVSIGLGTFKLFDNVRIW